MVVSPNMAKEAEVIHQQTMQYRFCVSKEQALVHQVDVAAPILRQVKVADSVSGEIARYDSVCFIYFPSAFDKRLVGRDGVECLIFRRNCAISCL